MFVRKHTALASLIAALASTFAATAHAGDVSTGSDGTPPPSATSSSTGGAALHGKIEQRLNGEIDSGWLDKGLVKVRTRFTIDPVKPDALLAIDMPTGAKVNATWSPSEKGSLTIHPVTEEGATGTMNVHYTLIPSLEANIYGTQVAYDATQLLAKIPGSSFNYDSKMDTTLAPWGFAGASATATSSPALDQSTIFSLSFEDLGIDPATVEGSLSIQAVAKPTFKYKTTEILFDSASVKAADGSAKISIADGDFAEVNATVLGEVALNGILDMRPVIKVDSVDGYPTFGLVKYSFSAVSKAFDGKPTPVTFQNATIHIPLPNVKVPSAPVGVGSAKAGEELTKSVTVNSTGEMDAVLKIESSDPQFIVPSGEIKVKSKGTYELDVKFKPSSDGPASATITVHSNDPDSPDQTFRVAANGASLEPEAADDTNADGTKKSKGQGDADVPSKDGCACSSVGSSSPVSSNYGVLGLLGLGLVLAARRRK